jgi:hypothetical protein
VPEAHRLLSIAIWVVIVLATVAAPGAALYLGAPWPLLGVIYLFLLSVGALVTLAILASYGG